MFCAYLVQYIKEYYPDEFSRQLILNCAIPFKVNDIDLIVSPYLEHIKSLEVINCRDRSIDDYTCILYVEDSFLTEDVTEIMLAIESWCIDNHFNTIPRCKLDYIEVLETSDCTSINLGTWHLLDNCRYIFDVSKYEIIGDKKLRLSKEQYEYLINNAFKFNELPNELVIEILTKFDMKFLLNAIKKSKKLAILINSEGGRSEIDDLLDDLYRLALKLTKEQKENIIVYTMPLHAWTIDGRNTLFYLRTSGLKLYDDADYYHKALQLLQSK